jgi:hypothetical protein
VYGDVLFEIEDGEEVTLAKDMLQMEPQRKAPKRAARIIVAGPPSRGGLLSYLQDKCWKDDR